MSQPATVNATPAPVAGPNYGKDAFAGFLVFLIALPLCLAISIASGCPPMAGVLTAGIGAILCAFVSNSELTIKGPAAGMIAIVLGAVTSFRDLGVGDERAYKMMLLVGVAAGIIQILFGLFKAGSLGEFFPTSAVHGLLASIGVIIISKQVHVVLGVMGLKGNPFPLLAQVPHSLMNLNPRFAIIGLISLVILFGKPFIKNAWVKRVPGQLIVLVFALVLGNYWGLCQPAPKMDQTGQPVYHHHKGDVVKDASGKEVKDKKGELTHYKEDEYVYEYGMGGKTYSQGPKYLVSVPNDIRKAFATPEMSALSNATFWKAAWQWILMFALIGSLESLLSSKAVDLIDPLKRKTNLNRDLLAVGIANTVVAAVGGLPMISEIVRSKANIDNGARSRVAGVVHGVCLLAFVALLPSLINQIPQAALAAMLVFTGFRLASPMEFIHIAHIGKEQLLVFVTTIVAVLMTDLLIGIAIGVVMEMCVHVFLGASIGSLFGSSADVEHQPNGISVITVRNAAMFSNWIPLRKKIVQYGYEMKNKVILDLSQARLVDHTVMDKLAALKADFTTEGLELEIRGLDAHQPVSAHPLATRRLVRSAN